MEYSNVAGCPNQNLPSLLNASGIDANLTHTTADYAQQTSTTCSTNQVQVATQTQAPSTTNAASVAAAFAAGVAAGAAPDKKQVVYAAPTAIKGKKARYPLLQQQQQPQQQQQAAAAGIQQQAPNFPMQNYPLDSAAAGG